MTAIERYQDILAELEQRDDISDADVVSLTLQQLLHELAGAYTALRADLPTRGVIEKAFDLMWNGFFDLHLPGPWNHPDEPGYATYPEIHKYPYDGLAADDRS